MLPRAPIESGGTFAGLSGSAILLGAFLDLALTEILTRLLVLWLAPDVMSQDQAAVRRAVAELVASNAYLAGNIAIGALCTVVGALIGARRAGQLHVRHGGWVAVTSQAIGVLLMALLPAPSEEVTEYPLWAEAVGWLLVLPAGMTGGALAAALPAAPRGRTRQP
ncbi:MAG: hypothetical protein E6J87_18960 [Deltaproteobacteria bacterium]|nr:MAG: hypothetical protein E6J87_18960 [Deltaproteobacteria bacterium]